MIQMLFESGIREYGPWMIVNGNCDVVRQLYDSHYSRPKASIGKAQFKRPGGMRFFTGK
jgi:hypothetical protein